MREGVSNGSRDADHLACIDGTAQVLCRVPKAVAPIGHHGAPDAQNFGITLSANRRRLSREPWPNSKT